MNQHPSNDISRSATDPAIASLSLADDDTREPHFDSARAASDQADQPQESESGFQLGDDGMCAECRRLFEALAEVVFEKDEAYVSSLRDHYESARAIHESSQRGCRVCTLLIECYGLEQFEEELQFERAAANNLGRPQVPQIRYHNPYGEELSLSLHLRDKSDWKQMMSFFPSEAGNLSPPINEIVRPSTSEYLPIAKHWLKECAMNHKRCSRATGQFLPTRLLCLGGDAIRLIHTAEILSTQVQYATLSHAWGKLDFIRLCKENFKDLQENVPERQLTKTFRDAIYVTRSLGLEYIWIDSLCIIQDDELDWLRESRSMAGVYGGSTINIAAAGSVDGNGGCLYEDSDRRTEYKAFRYRFWPPGMQDTGLWELAPLYLYPDCTSWTPLAGRAWALQERLLAPRTLQFSKTDLLWECHEKDACSLFPEGMPPSLCLHYTYRMRGSLASIWNQIVELYSAAQLTMYSDKLVALSGLAYAVQSETRDEYVAGMWRESLEAQLLWSSSLSNNEEMPPRPQPYRAPTWSWAVLDTGVHLFSKRSTKYLYAHVHNVYTQPTGPDPLGQISGGLLALSCSVLMRGTIAGKEDLKTENQENFDLYSFLRATVRFNDDTILTGVYWDAQEGHSGLLYFLPMSKDSSVRDNSGGVGPILGLVLRKILQTENMVRYSRLGMFRIDFHETRPVEKFINIMNKQKQTTPKSDFSRTLDRNEKYPEELGLIEII